jgi:hypothetical protein
MGKVASDEKGKEGGVIKGEKRLFRINRREEERFLSAQADAFAGANAQEKASACSVRNDGEGGRPEKAGLLRSK